MKLVDHKSHVSKISISFILLFLLAGCATYRFANETFNSPEAALAAQKKYLDEIKSQIQPVGKKLGGSAAIIIPTFETFVALGINPGGNDISLQSKPLNGRFVPWYELINFEREEWNAGISDEFIAEMRDGTFTNLASMFFGSLFCLFSAKSTSKSESFSKTSGRGDSGYHLPFSGQQKQYSLCDLRRLPPGRHPHRKTLKGDSFLYTDTPPIRRGVFYP